MWKKIKKFFFPCLENNYSPHILSGNFLFYWGLLILFLKMTLFPLYLYLPYNSFFAEITKSILLELTNKTRMELGLTPLKENVILSEAASQKGQDMLTQDYFSHKSPEGFYAWDILKKLGYAYKSAGENLAIGYLDSEEVHQAWLASPSHRANILNPQFQEIGLAVAKGEFEGNNVYVVVQIFGTPKAITTKEIQPPKNEISAKATATPLPIISSPITTPLLPEVISEQKDEEEKLTPETEKTEVIAEENTPITTLIAGSETQKKTEQKNLSFKVLKFLTTNYNNFIQKFIYGSIVLVVLILLLTIFIKIDIQYPSLIFKALAVIILLIFFLWLDKEYILQIIAPHQIIVF